MTIEVDCIWVNLKNVSPPFFKFISVYIKMSFKQLENHSQLLCDRDFANERLFLALPICRLELITNNLKQNYLKQRDLAPLRWMVIAKVKSTMGERLSTLMVVFGMVVLIVIHLIRIHLLVLRPCEKKYCFIVLNVCSGK